MKVINLQHYREALELKRREIEEVEYERGEIERLHEKELRGEIRLLVDLISLLVMEELD